MVDLKVGDMIVGINIDGNEIGESFLVTEEFLKEYNLYHDCHWNESAGRQRL